MAAGGPQCAEIGGVAEAIRAALSDSPVTSIGGLSLLADQIQAVTEVAGARSNPNLRRDLRSCEWRIGSQASDNLDAAIATAMGSYLENGRVHAYDSVVPGSDPAGRTLRSVRDRLLTVAAATDADESARRFIEAIGAESAIVEDVALLAGVRAREPLEVCDGVTLMSLPSAIEDWPLWVPAFVSPIRNNWDYVWYTGALLVTRRPVTPVLIRPSQFEHSKGAGPFTVHPPCQEIGEFDAKRFAHALALATRHPALCMVTWRQIPDDAFFAHQGGHTWQSATTITPTFATQEATAQDVTRALSLYGAWRLLTPDVSDVMDVAVENWHEASVLGNLPDAFVKLRRAIEMLYLDLNEHAPMRRLISDRAGRHIGGSPDERATVRREMKRAYDFASTAVHRTIKRKQVGRAKASFDWAVDACNRAFVRVLEDGALPLRAD